MVTWLWDFWVSQKSQSGVDFLVELLVVKNTNNSTKVKIEIRPFEKAPY